MFVSVCLCLNPDFESDKAKHMKGTIIALSHNYLQVNVRLLYAVTAPDNGSGYTGVHFGKILLQGDFSPMIVFEGFLWLVGF